MTTTKKAAPGDNRAASDTAFDSRHYTGTDPLTGWFGFAKESRLNRRKKRAWQRRWK